MYVSGVVEGERGGKPFPHFFHTKQNSCKIALFATVFTSISRRSPTSRSPTSFFRTSPLAYMLINCNNFSFAGMVGDLASSLDGRKTHFVAQNFRMTF